MQNTVAAANGRWGGHMGEVVPSLAFSFFFQLYDSFRICTAYPEKREFMLNAITNIFGGGVVCGRFAQGVKS